MPTLFLQLYDFFSKRRAVFWSVFLLLIALLAAGASQIKLEEDITKFFPDDPRVENLQEVFRHSKFVERLVIMVSSSDSTVNSPDSLVVATDDLIGRIERELQSHVKKTSGKISDDRIIEFFKTVKSHLPIFLNNDDYKDLDSLTNLENIDVVLKENYRQLISPSGIALKRIIAEDPLGFSFLVLRKLQQLQYDENFELYDNYIITRDHNNLIFFVEPTYGSQETGKNVVLLEKLNAMAADISREHHAVKVSYFGATAVAAGNARQLRNDSILTISIMIVLLSLLLIGFFRKKRAPVLILIPVAFGGLFALCSIYLIQSTVSVLALAAGSVILGIAVNYALHFLVHLRHTNNMRVVIADLVNPLTLGSATTVLAFFCLHFANAAVLRDVGLFAGLSLIGAAICSLVFLPHLMPESLFKSDEEEPAIHGQSKLFSKSLERRLVWAILLLTPMFFYFARHVNFNSDMSKLNFMHAETRAAQAQLEKINKSSLGTAYVVSRGVDLEHALRKTEKAVPILNELYQRKEINKFSSPALFLISDSLQQIRIERWKRFWNKDKLKSTIPAVRDVGTSLKFSEHVLGNFEALVTKDYSPADTGTFSSIRRIFFDDYIVERDSSATVISLVNIDPGNKAAVYRHLNENSTSVVDRQMLTNLFVDYIHADFDLIVSLTAVLVFLALLISYGRIELTVITFFPMFITWIWILGIMSILDIEFNIINVMVSTFIFGLGDDYSIFIMDGLQQEYRSGKKSMGSIRTSIFLSAITTIAGLGVLIFAKHPALRSIASISIIGIVCVFIMSQTIEPYLFRSLITNRTRKGMAPMTWIGMLKTFLLYCIFVGGSFALTAIGLVMKILPFKKQVRYFFHTLISVVNGAVMFFVEPVGNKKIIGKSKGLFSRPSIIVANHSSTLDILLITMLHPKLILMTNKWVWNSPVFGGVVRLAGYYPVTEGLEDSVNRLKGRIAEGYSVVVFPEGKRSDDGILRRFHKGAFFMAETFQLPILPLLIHGAAGAMPKGSFYLNEGKLTLKFLNPIEIDDARFGKGYAERTKHIGRHFKREFNVLTQERETPGYFKSKLIANYLYKGPVLEWYLRVKLRLENDYQLFHKLLPIRGEIIDLGCGYGFLCYMLQFLSSERAITGIDYDADKIETAQHGYLRTDRLAFHQADVTEYTMAKYDGIIISDVLHYLSPAAQDALLIKCFNALEPGGLIIIRDGNSDMRDRHRGTRITEFFSVKLFGFNKAVNALHFISATHIGELASLFNMEVEFIDNSKFTSNVIFVLRKPSSHR
ncbi:MAG: 1-acyl-sn-glycerol-3-phosphate acyltransferase [Chryseolinea sp.]